MDANVVVRSVVAACAELSRAGFPHALVEPSSALSIDKASQVFATACREIPMRGNALHEPAMRKHSGRKGWAGASAPVQFPASNREAFP